MESTSQQQIKPILRVCTEEDGLSTEFEVIPIFGKEKPYIRKQKEIDERIQELDSELDGLYKELEGIDTEIERLTNHADGLDYLIAVSSGILTGMMDAFFVEDFSLKRANEIGDKDAEAFVIKIAKATGYKGDDLYGAVKHLEKKYPIAADKETNFFGGGKQHHLRDFSHHPTCIGLFFSILTQFTKKVYGTNTAGFFCVVDLEEEDWVLIGDDYITKLIYGVVYWVFHMVSDLVGSSSSIYAGSKGTGLPGPLVSLLKELSALPVFKKLNENEYKELSVWVSKLFNGTLLGSRDENGKLIPLKVDLRTEIGVAEKLGQQAIPVLINECIVRGFFFVRGLCTEISEKRLKSFAEMGRIEWGKVAPWKNRTIARMLTISTGTFTAIDLADAAVESAIKSGGIGHEFARNMIVKVNFVGVGRFAFAIATDVRMGIQRKNKLVERGVLTDEIINKSTVKVYYQTASGWCEISKLYNQQREMCEAEARLLETEKEVDESMLKLYVVTKQAGIFYLRTLQENGQYYDEIQALVPEIENHNPGLVNRIIERAEA